ncbi:MFS transporter [Streptomyces antarcticus]|uniref:MFS transporter n=1 Tax=Streptomyces antarcticus TaxID=2996458 RepID=UPI002271F23F|nr:MULTISPECIES: MFS transporter [unclassified Streptomyces]MCY0946646.1 MFS transporter [Streptomyces sp. H34-AA3]MCZ4085662.1 MFS transporter [Streptomyces sp. H34-S5]
MTAGRHGAGLTAKWRIFTGLPAGLKALIGLSFVVALGSYMVTPFIGVLMVEAVGMDIRVAGVLVAVATFIQFGGSILGGAVVDRLGLKRTMVGALALRTAGLVLLGVAVKVPWVAYPAVVLVAAGPALYLPANKAYIVTSVSDELRPLFLGVSSAALNAGMGLGPLLAALLIDADPVVLLIGLAALFALITAAHQATLKPVARRPAAPVAGPATAAAGTGAPTGKRAALRGALRPVLFTGLAFYLYFFFQSFMGLYAVGVSDIRLLGWVMLLNCAMVVVLQPVLADRIARAGYRRLVVVSFALMALGTAAMALGGTPALLGGTALFTLGEVFLFLRCDLELVDRVPDSPAFAFGVQRLTAGIGGLLAGVVGGFVFAHYEAAGDLGGFWLVVAAQCAGAALLALLLGGRRRAAAAPGPPLPEASSAEPAVAR